MPADRSCLFGQHKEGGLECVLSVLIVSKHTLAHASTERPVPPHECVEGVLIPSGRETLQKLPVGEFRRPRRHKQAMEVTDDAIQLSRGMMASPIRWLFYL